MIILGIDPGVSGALAFYRSETGTLHVHDTPTVDKELDADTFAAIISDHRPDHAVIERVGAMPKQGVSSTFKFGASYGMARGIVAALGVPHTLVAPTVWKRHFALDSDGEKSRALALRTWPGCGSFARKKDHNRAEAALLALWFARTVLKEAA